jgi:hypothetical protein
MSGNTFVNYNQWKATKIYGSFEVKDYVGATGAVLDSGIITCKDIISSGNITINTSLLSSENSNKVPTTSWVKSLGYITSGATGYTGPQGPTGYTGPQGPTGSFNSSSAISCTSITTTGNINGISPTILGYLTGITSNVQGQFNGLSSIYVSTYTFGTTLSSYVTSSSLTTQLSNYLTTANASRAYLSRSNFGDTIASYIISANVSSTYATITNLNTTNSNVSDIQNFLNSNCDSTILNTGLIPYLTTLTTVSTNIFSQTFTLANTGYHFQVGAYIISCSGFNGSFAQPYNLFKAQPNGSNTFTTAVFFYSNGAYFGTQSTTALALINSLLTNQNYLGEWFQVYFNTGNKYCITSLKFSYVNLNVWGTMYIVGGNDGATWNLISTLTHISGNTNTINITNNSYYT